MHDLPIGRRALRAAHLEAACTRFDEGGPRLRTGNPQAFVEHRHRHRRADELLRHLIGRVDAIGVAAGHEDDGNLFPVGIHFIGEYLWQAGVHALPHFSLRQTDHGMPARVDPDPVVDFVAVRATVAGPCEFAEAERQDKAACNREATLQKPTAARRSCNCTALRPMRARCVSVPLRHG